MGPIRSKQNFNPLSNALAANALKKEVNTDSIKNTSKEIYSNFLETVKDPRDDELPGRTETVTGLDLYSLGEKICDDDLEYLYGLLGTNKEFIRECRKTKESIVTDKGFAKLNYILNMAAKHYFRRGYSHKLFRTEFGKWCEIKQDVASKKEKVYFNISNIEEYREFIQFATEKKTPDVIKEGENSYEQINNQRKGAYLKELLCFADLEKDDIYQNRRNLFQYITTDVFGKFFKQDIPIRVCTKTENKDHNHEVNQKLTIDIDGKKMKINLMGNIKSQNSLIDKQRRDSNYSASSAINDMMRYQVVVANHEQILTLLHKFIEYYQENPEHIFVGDANLEKIQIKDKGIIHSPHEEYRYRVAHLSEDTVSTFIQKAKVPKNLEMKDYRDVKLIIPMNMRGKLFNIEVKFVLSDWEYTNERGLDRHQIFKLIEKIKLKSRDQKFVLKSWIKKECEKLVEEVPELHEEIAKGNNYNTVENIYNHILTKVQPIHIPGYESEAVIHRDIFKNLRKKDFLPESVL